MSKKQSIHTTTVTKNMNSSSNSQSKNSKRKRNRKTQVNKPVSPQGTIVNVSVASSRRMTSQKPVTRNIVNGIKVIHTELVGPVFLPDIQLPAVNNDSLFTNYRLRCNPGSKRTFNWLSSLAPNFEYYKFHKLSFYFETRSSTATPGSIIISPDYDSADGQVAITEQVLFNNKGTVDDAVWKHLRCNLIPASMNRLYKAHANMSDERFEASSQDEKTIDCAQVFVCIDPASDGPLRYGKLFVQYEVDLTEPQAPTDPSNLGGVGMDPVINAGTWGASGSSVPITSNATFPLSSSITSDQGLFQGIDKISELLTYPTATVGRFARDYVGDLIMKRTGTVLGTNPIVYTGLDPNTPAGSVGDIVQPSSSLLTGITNAAATESLTVKNINAKAGDYLKMTAGFYTTMSDLNMQLAAVSNLARLV